MINQLPYQGWDTYTKCNVGPILLTPQISPSIFSTSSMVLMMMAVAAKCSLNKRVLATAGSLLHLYHSIEPQTLLNVGYKIKLHLYTGPFLRKKKLML
jgi:hypothetical protein